MENAQWQQPITAVMIMRTRMRIAKSSITIMMEATMLTIMMETATDTTTVIITSRPAITTMLSCWRSFSTSPLSVSNFSMALSRSRPR
jgi:hypothetical protein